MAALSQVATPLAERIERWAKSGKANSIPLHPQDYYLLEKKQGLIEKIEAQYNLEVRCLGGEAGMKLYMSDKKEEGEEES
jgi:hypothetical protein